MQLITRNRLGPKDSLEEALVKALNADVGPVIAIGRPYERLPALGAARMYVEDDRWRSEVERLLDGAALVVLRAGSSEGLIWELTTVVQRMPPDRVVLLLERGRKYDEFRAWANASLPKPLPAEWPGLAVTFNQDWTPIPADETLPDLNQGLTDG